MDDISDSSRVNVVAYTYDGFFSYRHSDHQRIITRALQRGLHSFARPIWKLRAVRLFRDETNLTANPNLWSTIEAALDDSRFFLLMASPEAADSHWVQKELDHWMRTRGQDNLIIVLTGGRLAWDRETNGFDTRQSDALPEAMLDWFKVEPLYVDLSWVHRPDQQLVGSNPRFLVHWRVQKIHHRHAPGIRECQPA